MLIFSQAMCEQLYKSSMDRFHHVKQQ